MQSVRAGSIQTHFSDFVFFLKIGSNIPHVRSMLGASFVPKLYVLVKIVQTSLQKVTRQPQTTPHAQARSALFRQETAVRATVEAVFEIMAENIEPDSKFVQNTEYVVENVVKTLFHVVTLQCFLKSYSRKRKGKRQEHKADDLTRLGQRPGELFYLSKTKVSV